LANIPPDLWVEHLHHPSWFGVQTLFGAKQDIREWRALTAKLLQSATGHEYRFESGHVSGLIRAELGRFFRPVTTPAGQTERDEMLDEIDSWALKADRWFHVSPQSWDISFTDPATGQASGFPYLAAPPDGRDGYNDGRCIMVAHVSQSVNRMYKFGCPVDHVVRPCLVGEAMILGRRAHGPYNRLPMVVAVHEFQAGIFGDEEEDVGEEEAGEEDEGEEKLADTGPVQ
jgi:hypothetical protein